MGEREALPLLASAAPGGLDSPSLTVALALVAGLFCQALAHHLRIPGIVLLLLAGAVLGPDVLDVVRPGLLGDALQALTGFAVAVILFEGAMNLQVARLRRESASIRDLILLGAVVTAVGGTLAARVFLHWDWRLAILFGTLVIVTGPTVVAPLVRRIRLRTNLQTVLEAEGVLIDPVGAIIAVVALEVVTQPAATGLAAGVLGVATRLGLGSVIGIAGGFAMAWMLRPRWLIPPRLRNVFALSLVLALFHVSNALLPESGIASVTVAGLVVGNVRSAAFEDLLDFKEQLTVMLIGLLFVLLSADVRFGEITALGRPGLYVVLALVFVVRPLNTFAGTHRSRLTWRERAFIAWMAPRGIVAAGVASLFALRLAEEGFPGGPELRALIFLVIAVTVPLYGLTGDPAARLLGVKREANRGYVILGANPLARAVGLALRGVGEEAVFIDSNPDAVRAAEREGFRVILGNAFEERLLLLAGVDAAAVVVGLTANEEVNLLFVRRAAESSPGIRSYVALHLDEGHITEAMVKSADARRLFGVQRDLDLWSVRLERRLAAVERRRLQGAREAVLYNDPLRASEEERAVLPILWVRRGATALVDERTRPQEGDDMTFLVLEDRRDDADRWFGEWGWSRVETGPGR